MRTNTLAIALALAAGGISSIAEPLDAIVAGDAYYPRASRRLRPANGAPKSRSKAKREKRRAERKARHRR